MRQLASVMRQGAPPRRSPDKARCDNVTHVSQRDRDHDARMRSSVITVAALHLAVAASVLGSGAMMACNGGAKPSVEAGRDLYTQNGCASCHGPGGHGDGPVGQTLEIRPRDFGDAAAFRQGTDVDSIATTIAIGVSDDISASRPASGSDDRLDGRQVYHHTQVMPRFDHLSDMERRSLALYVISLQGSRKTERKQP